MYTHTKQVITSGVPLAEAEKAIVMLHGRGGSARDIISLNKLLHLEKMAIVAPQANNSSWYPYSFMAPESQNQPALDSAVSVIEQVVKDVEAAGIEQSNIYFAGFSQGACLTLEYVARHAQRYGGVIALTGGLIGEQLVEERYTGDFAGTPVFISTGDPDPHVPVSRVKESVAVLERLNAFVTYAIYPGRPHNISAEEIRLANTHILA
ncbi:alpha/beta hydrolase [Dyadobacter sandarakinus]|uniref:Alpha/beta hydrolase fold domain-containing protein n=1 Tax=Dyadobacter sandarakinus TaxID=2747268 RepID=A0ABX7I5H9_9BACT|nr:dienelactone hydrolase family protein [Dyadobacter sandarakinus]QRR01118.1 alpha/beta hydrolase fold domain-containing protein [Dyadobacter sandarakinus]